MAACPVCSAEFESEVINRVTVAMCSHCEGVWLAEGDLDGLAGQPLEEELRSWMTPPQQCRYCHSQLGFSETCLQCGKHPTIACPRGHGVMSAALVRLAGRDFEVDECPSCHGIWIDGHEVEHLDAAQPREARQFERFELARVRTANSHPSSLMDGVPRTNVALHALYFMSGGIGGWSPHERSESGVLVVFLVIAAIAVTALYFFGGGLLAF